MHKGKNIIRKKGNARLSAAIFLLSAGMLQAGIQGVSASEADFFTEEVILPREEETPQQEPQQAGQGGQGVQPSQSTQSAQNAQLTQNAQPAQNAQPTQKVQSGQSTQPTQKVQSGQSAQDARDAQPSTTGLTDKAGTQKKADTDPLQGGERKTQENPKSGEDDEGSKAGQEFYTPDAAREQTHTERSETVQTAQQTQTERSKTGETERDKNGQIVQQSETVQTEQDNTGQMAQQTQLQPDMQIRENRENVLFWGMLFVAVGLFAAGTWRLRANTFMRW